MPEQSIRIVIRFPSDIYDKLKSLAEKDNRSINGEVITAIKSFIEEHEKQHGPIKN